MKKPMLLFSFLTIAVAVALTVACTKKSDDSNSSATAQMTSAQLAARGRTIYTGNCIACHNSDPTKDGAVGPAIAGSSAELIEARVMRTEYPAGYKPKRDTHIMTALPHLKNEIPALAAYLSSIGGVAK